MTQQFKITLIAALSTVLIACGGKNASSPTPPAPVAPTPAPVNTAPTATIGADRTTIEEGDTFDLTAGTSSDPDGDALTYYWVQLSGPDLGISDRTVETLTLRVSDVQQDETAEFELTVSDGNFEDKATVTLTFANVDQMPKLNAPTFAVSQSEIRLDGPVRLVRSERYDALFPDFPDFSRLARVISANPGGDELRGLTLPASGDNIEFTPALSPSPLAGPTLSEEKIIRYSLSSRGVIPVVPNTQIDRVGVGFDTATNDLTVFGYPEDTGNSPFDLARGNVPDACHFIGEVEFNGLPNPTETRRYYAVGLTSGGLSLWSTFEGFVPTGSSATTTRALQPGLRLEGQYFATKSFCGPTVVVSSNNVDPFIVFDATERSLRRYELQSDGDLSSVRLSEFVGDAVEIDLGTTPNLTFRDGLISETERNTQPRAEQFPTGTFVGVWSDGVRDGEHRLVVVTTDGRVEIKSWATGVPEQVRLSLLGHTPAGTVTFPPEALVGSGGTPTFQEPTDIFIMTPDVPSFVVFRAHNYEYLVSVPDGFGSPFPRIIPREFDIFPLSDAQFVDVGLDATNLQRVEPQATSPSRTDHVLMLYKDRNKVLRYNRKP